MNVLRWSCCAALVLTLGCAGSYKKAYVAGAVTKEFTTTMHAGYSEALHDQLEHCDPQKNPESPVATKKDFDLCMGEFFDHAAADAVVKAFGIYKAAAEALSVLLLTQDASPQQLRDATTKVVDSAFAVLALFPEADEKTQRLRMLLGR